MLQNNNIDIAVQVHEANNVDDLLPVLIDLRKSHVAYGVLESHYDLVGQSLFKSPKAAKVTYLRMR